MVKTNDPYLNIISGRSTSKLVEALNEQFADSTNIYYAHDALNRLYDENDDAAYGLVRILYDLSGLTFPVEAEAMCQTNEGKHEYLSSVLSDISSMIY